MRIEALSKTLVFFDMRDVFQIIPIDMVSVLEMKLNDMFTCQET